MLSKRLAGGRLVIDACPTSELAGVTGDDQRGSSVGRADARDLMLLDQVLGVLVPAMAGLATLDVLGEDGTPERVAVVHATDPALAALLHETACDLQDGTTATTLLVLRSGTPQLREACDPIRFELFHDGTNL